MQNQLMSRLSEWTIIKLLRWATSCFKAHGIDSPRATAEILLAHVLNLERTDLYLRQDQLVSSEGLEKFKALIKRRVQREPVAYILGSKEFWSMDLVITADVLIPRPETECLVEAAQDMLSDASSNQPQQILELGTGSGAVILALASQNPQHLYFASDLSVKALAVAGQNARRHHLDGKIHFFCSGWFSALSPKKCSFDMILSNPPYIKTGVIDQLQPEIFAFEPAIALDGGEDGLDRLRHIIACAHFYLKPGGVLLLEIAHDQKKDVRRIMDECDQYEHFACRQDYSGYDRVIQMRKKCCAARYNLLSITNFLTHTPLDLLPGAFQESRKQG